MIPHHTTRKCVLMYMYRELNTKLPDKELGLFFQSKTGPCKEVLLCVGGLELTALCQWSTFSSGKYARVRDICVHSEALCVHA